MDDTAKPGGDLDIEALTRALERIRAASGAAGTETSATKSQASGLSLKIGMRHTVAGDRRRNRRYAYGQTVIAPGPDAGDMPAVLCLDIGPGGALVRLTSHRETGYRPPQADAAPARWLGGRIIARRGALHHVAFPEVQGPLLQAEFDALLAKLEQRDRRIGAKMKRLAGLIERRVGMLNDHGVIDLLWSNDYMALPEQEAGDRRQRCLSPASAAFDAILTQWLQTMTWRLPGDALTLLVDRNGHVAAAFGAKALTPRWRGTFVEAPAFILAARFAKKPALALLPPAAQAVGDMWLATAPLRLSGRRWGCVAVLRPLRASGCAEPSPAE